MGVRPHAAACDRSACRVKGMRAQNTPHEKSQNRRVVLVHDAFVAHGLEGMLGIVIQGVVYLALQRGELEMLHSNL